MNVEIELNKSSVIIDNNKQKNIDLKATYTEHLIANNYKTLKNQPKIEGVTLIDNKTFEDLGAVSLSNLEIEKLINLQI